MNVPGTVPGTIEKVLNLRAERLPTMENKKNRMGKVRKTPGQAKPEPRQEPRPSQPKPNQSNATDERPCYWLGQGAKVKEAGIIRLHIMLTGVEGAGEGVENTCWAGCGWICARQPQLFIKTHEVVKTERDYSWRGCRDLQMYIPTNLNGKNYIGTEIY